VSDKSQIEWTEATWNPILGCTKVSPGCDHCYAITQATIRAGNPHPKVAAAFAGLTKRAEAGPDWTGRVNLLPDRLMQPVKWRKPKRVFVNSLADLFHDDVPDAFIAQVFAVMAITPQHSYQLLTKRHGRMKSLLSGGPRDAWLVPNHPSPFVQAVYREARKLAPAGPPLRWPLPNLWLGVSAEDQHWAKIRVHALLSTPAVVRWVSAEPLLGPIDLRNLRAGNGALIDALCGDVKSPKGEIYAACPGSVSWVVAGGESGPGARPMAPDWARSLRDQCRSTRVPFLFKQWGEWGPTGVVGRGGTNPREIFVRDSTVTCHDFEGAQLRRMGKKATGRELDGRTWDEYPGVLQGAAA
jgi:protein gp37